MRQFTFVKQGRIENEFKAGLQAATYFSAGPLVVLTLVRSLAGRGRQSGTAFFCKVGIGMGECGRAARPS